jgi:hypothetical protein
MPADRVHALEHVGDRVHIDLARLSEIDLAGRALDRNELTDDARRAPTVAGLLVAGRPSINSGGCGPALSLLFLPFAGQKSDRGNKRVPGDMHDQIDDGAALGASSTMPNLFSGGDGESVDAAAGQTWSSIFSAADRLEMSAEVSRGRKNVGPARLLDGGLEEGHCAVPLAPGTQCRPRRASLSRNRR